KPGDGIKAQRRGGILLKEQVPRTVEAEDQPPRPRRLREADIARRTGDRPRKDKFASRALDGGRAQGAFCSPQEQAVLYAILVDVHLRADNGAGQTAFKGELPGCCPAAGKGDPNTDGETYGPTALVHNVPPCRGLVVGCLVHVIGARYLP